jgi:ERCC4-type nuclease
MLMVDNRAGSADFYPLLRALGMDAQLTTMPYGDVAFVGVGPDKEPVTVGAEIKSIDDCLACIISGRFAGHQLLGLIPSFDHIYLMVIGEYRARARDGVMEQLKVGRNGGMYWAESGGGQRRWMWRDFESWLLSMSIMGGLRVIKVDTVEDGAAYLKVLYNWYQRDEHKSHLVLYSGKEIYSDSALLVRPSLVRRVAAELPWIGVARSADVARVFKTVLEMAEAGEERWSEMIVDGGKRLGERGLKIWKAIRGYANGNGKGGSK